MRRVYADLCKFMCAAQAGNADIIQPGLSALQPSLEEIMRCLDDSFETRRRDEHHHSKGAKGQGSPYKLPRDTEQSSADELSPTTMLVNCTTQSTSAPHFAQVRARRSLVDGIL